ncbi:MAG: hypothetical protein IKC64_02265 [Clostridia bacterium]|nr:hypothetical protein [Clostridia bacterium]
MDKWRYYNHAAIQVKPHDEVDTTVVENGEIWKMEGSPLLARWTSNFDCGYETNWWYVIIDTPFDKSQLNSNRRYKITKGNRNFEVKRINPIEYKDELFDCQVKAFEAYPKKYRPKVTYDGFIKSLSTWDEFIAYGAFNRETGKLSGYSLLKRYDERYIDFCVQKSIPDEEKLCVNFALVDAILADQAEFIKNGGYICDGARNVSHETHFQDFLEKYFGFRKAYCKLNIAYKPKIKFVVKMLYPLRKLLKAFDGIKFVHKMNAILKMEELVRNGNEESVNHNADL